jgi:hypothetical protein
LPTLGDLLVCFATIFGSNSPSRLPELDLGLTEVALQFHPKGTGNFFYHLG